VQRLTEDQDVEARIGDRRRLDPRLLARDGSLVIAAGSLVAGLAAYAFQVLGGRALGEEGFAPVASLLSVHSLILAVLLTPVELLTVRRLTLARGGRPDADDRRSIAVTVLVSVAAMVAFVGVTMHRFFSGDRRWLLVGAMVVGTHAVFALGRGALAGNGRYVAYGLVSGGAAILRVLVAVVWLTVARSDLILAWAVAIPPLIVLGWHPFQRRSSGRPRMRESSGSLMAGFVLAGAISQAFVLIGPLLAGALETDPTRVATVVSVVFVTFSLARAPILIAQNLAARVLAGLTRLVAEGSFGELRTWSRRLGVGGLITAPIAYVVASRSGPDLIGALFGDRFRPSSLVAGMAAAACALAATSVFIDQVLIAMGATGKLAGAWTLALLAGGATGMLAAGEASDRVCLAVAGGELAALVAVMAAAEVAAPESPDTGYDLVKRAIDMVTAVILLAATVPLQLLVAVAVRLDSGGSSLFRQIRVGKNERTFVMYKFRTMQAGTGDDLLLAHLAKVAAGGFVHPNIRAEGPALYVDADPRLTRVGRWLRRFSLDELPNMWNVLRGHMSLVGPRPLIPQEVEVLDPEARARHKVRPGVTGLAQVEGGSEITFGERADWDLRYVADRSLALDLRILLSTPAAALQRKDHG
jgi:lipopolysaccharide/colanic/teichoic acid biosynthesis glycosyltransferase/O-antigen/teichoic acid export membrane protein